MLAGCLQESWPQAMWFHVARDIGCPWAMCIKIGLKIFGFQKLITYLGKMASTLPKAIHIFLRSEMMPLLRRVVIIVITSGRIYLCIKGSCLSRIKILS